VKEIYSISLTVSKTEATTVYLPRDLTLNNTIILPEHPVHIRLIRFSQQALRISLCGVENFVCVMGTELLLPAGN
jgi:hypothetical protein